MDPINSRPVFNGRPSAESPSGYYLLTLRWNSGLFEPLKGKPVWQQAAMIAGRILAALGLILIAAAETAVRSIADLLGCIPRVLYKNHYFFYNSPAHFGLIFKALALPYGYLPKVNFLREPFLDKLQYVRNDFHRYIDSGVQQQILSSLDRLDDLKDINELAQMPGFGLLPPNISPKAAALSVIFQILETKDLVLKKLVKLGFNVNEPVTFPSGQMNALQYIAREGMDRQVDNVKLLLESGADPNALTKDNVPIIFEFLFPRVNDISDRIACLKA